MINREHEAIAGGFKCVYWLLKHIIAPQLTFNSHLMQGSMEPLQNLLHHESVSDRALPSVSCWSVSGPCHKEKHVSLPLGCPSNLSPGIASFLGETLLVSATLAELVLTAGFFKFRC